MGNMMLFNLSTPNLEDLFTIRDRIRVYPSCQREKVWEDRRKQRLIDSIIRGIPIPPIAIVETYVELIGSRKDIVDGQQRLETIFEFMNDGFPTGKKFGNDETIPMYPGLRYSQLPQDIRNAFNSYHFPVVTIEGADADSIPVIFRRWQLGVPLTLAEILFSFEGPTKELARAFSSHEFWSSIYSGNKIHRQPFQAGVKMMLLEMYDGFANLTTPRQRDALSVSRFTEEAPKYKEIMLHRLDMMTHVFWGADATAVNHAVFMYQTVVILEGLGIKLRNLSQGALSVWFQKVYIETTTEKKNGYSYFFGQFEKVSAQRAFWGTHLDSLLQQITVKDARRNANDEERIKLWISQNGLCAICRKPIKLTDSIADHLIPHALGGKTAIENMRLVHNHCHTGDHLIRQDVMLNA
jgi:hypothetical protein